MKKVIGLMVVVLTVLGLGGVVDLNTAKASGEDKDAEGGNIYYEIVDISEYSKDPLQVKVNGGEIVSFGYEMPDGRKLTGNGEYTSKSGLLLGSTSTVARKSGNLILEIRSITGEYTIELNDTRSKQTAVDLTDIDVENGNYIQAQMGVRYKSKEAPTILLPTGKGEIHTSISTMQKNRRVKEGFGTDVRYEFNESYRELMKSGVETRIAKKAMRESYKYYDGLDAFK